MSKLITVDKQAFEKFVIESVEKTLSALGEGTKDAILMNFMNKYHLASREELADHPREFENFLWGIFDNGANIIIRTIVIDMFEKLGILTMKIDTDLATAIQTLKKMAHKSREL